MLEYGNEPCEPLGRVLLSLHNHIYANEGYSTHEAFVELVKLLFIKAHRRGDSRDQSRGSGERPGRPSGRMQTA